MTRFAAPTADPSGLREAARRLATSAVALDARGASVALASGDAVQEWSGSASLQFLARARSLRDSTAQAGDALQRMASATSRYADEVDQARGQVSRLNDQWEDAVARARAQARAAAEQAREDAQRARAAGEEQVRRTYDDGSAALREQEDELVRRYQRVTGELEDAGFSLERALREKDPIALLPAWVAGGVRAGKGGWTAKGLVVTKGFTAARYTSIVLRTGRYFDLGDDVIRTAVARSAEAERLRDVLTGRNATGRFATASRTAGRVFLPMTFVTGAVDMVTGGGHSGARRVVTHVAGGAGMLGAAGLMATYAGVAVLGPVGVAIAAAAVIGYGLWSLGGALWDHREDIGAFFGTVGRGIGSAGRATGRALVDGARTAVDAGRKVVDLITTPRKLLPDLGGVF